MTLKIPIVLTFDNTYAPIAGVFLKSLCESKLDDTIYDIYVLGDKLEDIEKERLADIVEDTKNTNIFYIDLNAEKYKSSLNKQRHSTASTFFRLKLATLFPEIDRIIYLDTDMICNKDLSELFHIDISDKCYAAALDYNHLLGVYRNQWQRKYYIEELRWPEEHLLNYKQAGVIVFNLERMRKLRVELEFEKLMSKNYRMMDQDILNIAVPVSEVHQLDLRWNVLTSYGTFSSNRSQIPRDFFVSYMDAFRDPYIIHFGGKTKPWNSNGGGTSLHHYFWKNAIKTDYYSHLLLLASSKLSDRN